MRHLAALILPLGLLQLMFQDGQLPGTFQVSTLPGLMLRLACSFSFGIEAGGFFCAPCHRLELRHLPLLRCHSMLYCPLNLFFHLLRGGCARRYWAGRKLLYQGSQIPDAPVLLLLLACLFTSGS